MILKVLGSGGSEGIPCALCSCRVCQTDIPRLRSSYLLKLSNRVRILIEASPDLREQFLRYRFDFDYCFISHPHYDHINGVHELKQMFIVNKDFLDLPEKKRTFIIGSSLYEFLKTGYRNDISFAESIKESFFHLLQRARFTMKVLNPYKFYDFPGFKIMILINLHGAHLSNGFILQKGKKSIAYLSDVGVLDRVTTQYLKDLKPDLTIVHTPYVISGLETKHIGINNLEEILESKKVLISHFSHRAGLTHREIEEEAKKVSPRIIVAKDGMEIEV